MFLLASLLLTLRLSSAHYKIQLNFSVMDNKDI